MSDFPSDLKIGSVMPVEDVSDRPLLSFERLQEHARHLREIEGNVPLTAYVYGEEMALRINCQGIDRGAYIERLCETLPALAANGAKRMLLAGDAKLQQGEGVVVTESRPDGGATYAAKVGDDGALGPWSSPDPKIMECFWRIVSLVWDEERERPMVVHLPEAGVLIDLPASGLQAAPRVTAEQLRCQAKKLLESGSEVPLRAYAYGPQVGVCIEFEALRGKARWSALPSVLRHLAKQGADVILVQDDGRMGDGYGAMIVESRPAGHAIYAAKVLENGALGPWGAPEQYAVENLTNLCRYVWDNSGDEAGSRHSSA